jgi:probable phosphoglycerate mutase
LRIALIRHGPTEWNAQGRIQGRIDMPLSDEGRAKMAALSPPEGFVNARAFASPLGRARETALLLRLVDPVIDERLTEHHWGDWEGMTRDEILTRDGADAFERAGAGLDFRPPNGESTRALMARVESFLSDVSQGGDAIAIAHRGVLRAAYALAMGWNMTTPMPEPFDISQALVLRLAPGERPAIAALNAPLKAI